MSDQAESIPMTITAVDDESTRGFAWRVTDEGEGKVGVAIGDLFDPDPVWPGEQGMLAQIGMGMVLRGMYFLGIPSDERKLLGHLILTHANGVELSDPIEAP